MFPFFLCEKKFKNRKKKGNQIGDHKNVFVQGTQLLYYRHQFLCKKGKSEKEIFVKFAFKN